MTDKQSDRKRELAENRRVWEDRIRDWQSSGLSQAEYQRRHNLRKWQFVYWKKKFEGRPSEESALVPIALPFQKESDAPLCLIVDERYRVEIPDGFRPDNVIALKDRFH
ncbi:MAG: IS66 family insertion sequence element accessory protein TnpB [Thermodesulfobacteriota bacterium]|nr:IS66 family insertion sequence element accessory protein TnpB [Thermodesulfobacteriota bacterium]